MRTTIFPIFHVAASPVANHLWQSTVFVLAVSLLTFLFAKNRARIRYMLWLAASAKFLIPFSVLMAFGSLIPLPTHGSHAVQPSLISYAYIANQPFSGNAITGSFSNQNLSSHMQAWLPATLASVWALGFAAVLLTWYVRWRQVSKILRRSVPADANREVELLRRIENDSNVRTRSRFVVSRDVMEPGVYGIFRPVMLWPAKLSAQLADAHLDAILAHEVAHVQHRDNLTASLHMIVEVIFWFHPFVWWIERKMLEERERACDEAVVRSGNRAEIYAESLLKVSRFCAELPLTCVAGITGADLSRRIRSIMLSHSSDLGIAKRLVLVACAVIAVAGPVAFGLMQGTQPAGQVLRTDGPLPTFEVISIKPSKPGSGTFIGAAGHGAPDDRFIVKNMSIKKLISWAYAGTSLPLPLDQVSGGPDWINSNEYDIDAKLDDAQVAAMKKASGRDQILQIRRMAQGLLRDRLKLGVNDKTVTRPVYDLVVARGGPKLQAAKPDSLSKIKFAGVQMAFTAEPGEMHAWSMPISALARALSIDSTIGRPVLDKTGLQGNYAFDLKWTPDFSSPGGAMPGRSQGPNAPGPPESSGPSIFSAIQEQLGLKLEPAKGPVEAIEIVHIEKPSEN